MFDYQKLFAPYCREHALPLHLSAVMPVGYQNANGTFDVSSKTVFINAVRLNDAPNHEKAFFLFHELRHASQYLCPSLFSDTIRRSLQYIIQYDGTCYKQINDSYRKCKLDGSEEYFTNLYLGQPHEVDANRFAYEQTQKLYGDSAELKALFDFWMPRQPVPVETYNAVFSQIDESISHELFLEEAT